MVSTVDQLATGAGLDLLRRGGSAADAAVGANAVLAVTSPHLCGMGGDAWALVHVDGEVHALDASGRAGSGADAERLRQDGFTRVPPKDHIAAVTVPAAVDGWLALHERFGRLPLDEVLAAAIGYARDGFPAAPLLAWTASLVAGVPGNEIPGSVDIGDLVRRPGSARALQALAAQGRDGFYGGEFGDQLLAVSEGQFSADDLADDQARWVTPLSVDVWGHRVWSPPPTSQGYLTLLAAAIVDGFAAPVDTHVLVEAAVQAGHDRPLVLHDGADGAALLADVDRRRAAIDPERTGCLAAPAADGDTTYLCAVDGDRMGVSLINSNASGYGAHIVAGTTGIFLHDRGLGFSLEPGHPAELAPGRRPPHTLSPALVTRPDGSLRTVLGTMGGDAQPQIVLQLLHGLLVEGLDPGSVIDRPRWQLASGDDGFSTWDGPRVLAVEEGFDGVDALTAKGHDVRVRPRGFGHAHAIEVGDVVAGAADPRAITGSASGI